MLTHTWVLENLASYSAGGLEPEERERLERHAAECADCSQALEETRDLDRSLENLFAGARPQAGLEDRLIQALRSAPARRKISWFWGAAMSAAAVVLIGIVGAGANALMQGGRLWLPRMEPLAVAVQNKKAPAGLHNFHNEDNRMPEAWNTWQIETLGDSQKKAEVSTPKPPSSGRISGGRGFGGDGFGYGTMPGQPMPLDGTAKLSIAEELAESLRQKTVNFYSSNGSVDARIPGASITTGNAGANGDVRFKEDGKQGEPSSVTSNPPQAGQKAELHYSYRNNQPSLGRALETFQGGTVKAEEQKDEKNQGKADHFKPAAEAYKKALEVRNNLVPEKEAEKLEGLFLQEAKNRDSKPPVVPRGQPPSATQKPDPTPPAPSRKIIRTGEVEFEIDSFDSAVASITSLVSNIKGGYVATVNSEKLPNGKVRGSVVVRVPPENLDKLLLDLRKVGDLKSQKIGSQDVTKLYTDLESRLRAARAMEERLLRIIKDGKGEIKDLIVAEKELGVWRTKIEEHEGELRYYASQVAFSTLTITLTEKEIRAPFAIIQTERIDMGLEVEDVEKTQQAALTAIADAKGRIIKSELKQLAAGQLQALIHFDVPADSAGPLRDRLKQLGNVARFEINRLQQTEGGSGKAQDIKSTRKDSEFILSIYNLANVAPRETTHLNLACVDTESVYHAILKRVRESTGRVVTSNLNRQRNEQTTGTVQIEVKTADAESLLTFLKEQGEILRLQVTENADTANVTKAKRGFQVQLFALGQVQPRETTVLQLAATDVPAAYEKLKAAVEKANGRILTAQLNEQDKQNVNGQLDFDIRRTEHEAVIEALKAAGEILSRNTTRSPDGENTIDSKMLLKVSLVNVGGIRPRESITLALEVKNVEETAGLFTAQIAEQKGRLVDSQVAHERTGQTTARLIYDVPLSAAGPIVDKFKSAGIVRVQQSFRNPQVPEGRLARALINVTLSNTPLIVPSDEGIWPQIRSSLSYSFKALSWSLMVVILGVCVLLPWALVIFGVYKLVVRLRRRGIPAA